MSDNQRDGRDRSPVRVYTRLYLALGALRNVRPSSTDLRLTCIQLYMYTNIRGILKVVTLVEIIIAARTVVAMPWLNNYRTCLDATMINPAFTKDPTVCTLSEDYFTL